MTARYWSSPMRSCEYMDTDEDTTKITVKAEHTSSEISLWLTASQRRNGVTKAHEKRLAATRFNRNLKGRMIFMT